MPWKIMSSFKIGTSYGSGLKVNDQLVAYMYATRFLAVRLKKYVW